MIDRRLFLKQSLATLLTSLFPVPSRAQTAAFDDIDLIVPTFLGNSQRNFYGRGRPEALRVLATYHIGCGKTRIGGTERAWCGLGWTGQPIIIRDNNDISLVVGGFDHHLHRIAYPSMESVWRYGFDDVLKATPTAFINESAPPQNRIVILQGSRQGSDGDASSFRAISFRTGEELWRLNLKRTRSYSRDNDSSPLLFENQIFNAGENGIGYFLNLQGGVEREVQLFTEEDVAAHRGNLVAEASPSRWGKTIYIASGSGHIYGLSTAMREIVWDLKIGSDLDGTTPFSHGGFLFCPVEKQYIPGQGGVLKIDPRKPPQKAIQWFLPTKNDNFASWNGGVIGSVALNDNYSSCRPRLFAVAAIDGMLYLGSQDELSGERTLDPAKQGFLPVPKILARTHVGPSISTPIFTDGDRLVVASYDGVRLFQIEYNHKTSSSRTARTKGGDYLSVNLSLIDHFKKGESFEATPVVFNDKVFIGGRDGVLYVLG